MIKALVVDDEFPAREELIYMLNKYSEIEVIGEASHGKEALDKTKELKPDVMFLDVSMPSMSGMEVAKRILDSKIDTRIVFVTAYDEYALEAFRVNAVDYILKPISKERFKEAIDRLVERLEGKTNYSRDIENILGVLKQPQQNDVPKRVSLYSNEKLIPVELKDIIYATVMEKDTVIFTKKGKFQINNTLLELEENWGSEFFRTHRSFLVNLDSIEEIEPWFNSTYNLKLNAIEENIPVSRGQSKEFKKIMNIE